MATDVARRVRAAEAAELRAQGLTYREIADRMGVSRSYASELIHDPDGSRAVERKRRCGGVCEGCGGPTDGSNGRAKAPKWCQTCRPGGQVPAEHGTRTRYTSGCGCDDCREANRVYVAERLARSRGKPPPSHGASGYTNYGCRCGVCTRAHTEQTYGYRQRWLRRKAAT